MRVLVACEFSGTVRRAFRERGHDAWSCDLIPCTDRSKYHMVADVLSVLWIGWDLMVAHPPCDYLTNTGNRWFVNNPERWEGRLKSMVFVKALMDSKIPRIAIENPAGAISTWIRKPDQYIEPYQFGHPGTKKQGYGLKTSLP